MIDALQAFIVAREGPALIYVTEGQEPTFYRLDIGDGPSGRDQVIMLALLPFVLDNYEPRTP